MPPCDSNRPVTIFWPCPEVVIISDYRCTGPPGYSDIMLTVTIFGRPNTVTVSGDRVACTHKIGYLGNSDKYPN